MRYIVIGDIHGCHKELVELLDLIELTDEDEIISIGDIIHKGPSEVECLEEIFKASKFYILGNHEDKQLRWEKHNQAFEDVGKLNPMKHVEDYKKIDESLLVELKDMAKIFHKIEVMDREFLLVHGGIEPRVRSLPKKEDAYGLSRKEKSFFWNVLRTRHVDPSGSMVSLGTETDNDLYWAEVYDGRFGHVLFGHQPFFSDRPAEFKHATGIDLGCVYGGYLCAFIINGDTGETSYVTVKAHEEYMAHSVDRNRGPPSI